MMKILVTGSEGFVGQHLSSLILEMGHELYKTSHTMNDQDCLVMDVCNKERVFEVLDLVKPDAIIHLAAISKIQVAWESPSQCMAVNCCGTLNIVEGISKVSPHTKLLIAGSSEEYGPHDILITEDTPCVPQNPYASSKFIAGQIALQLSKKYGIHVIHTRPFNHFGPGQEKGFVISDFASQIAAIEKKIMEPILTVGNISVWRDFTDVRDIVKGYIELVEQTVPSGIYNLCSGTPRAVKEILHFLLANSSIKIEIEMSTNISRQLDVNYFAGSNQKVVNSINWKPQRVLEDSLLETLDWWRNRI